LTLLPRAGIACRIDTHRQDPRDMRRLAGIPRCRGAVSSYSRHCLEARQARFVPGPQSVRRQRRAPREAFLPVNSQGSLWVDDRARFPAMDRIRRYPAPENSGMKKK